MSRIRNDISLYDWSVTNNPLLMEEWDKSNNMMDPKMVGPMSNVKAHWVCKKHGHTWESVIASRTKGANCPYCANYKAWPGFNDLATTDPKIAEQWDYSKNGDLKPSDVVHGSARKVWWTCKNEHHWQASICSRRNNGCPICSNQICCTGVNDLATTNPELSNEWHPS